MSKRRGSSSWIRQRAVLASGACALAFATLTTIAAAGTAAGLSGRLLFATNAAGLANRLEIAVVNSDGSGLRALTRHKPTGNLLDWTSDGRGILFATEDDYTGRSAIWRVDSHAGRFPRLPGEPWDMPSPSRGQ